MAKQRGRPRGSKNRTTHAAETVGSALGSVMAKVDAWMAQREEIARQFNQEDGTPGRQVWYSYWDRCLWTEGDFWSRINYIHRNPVEAGIVADCAEYPWSSHRSYLGRACPAWLTTAPSSLRKYTRPPPSTTSCTMSPESGSYA